MRFSSEFPNNMESICNVDDNIDDFTDIINFLLNSLFFVRELKTIQ